MTKADKRHWIVVLVYDGLLCLSLVAFLKNPNPYPGGGRPDLNALFQIFGPTLGTCLLVGFTVGRMAGKSISMACGLGAIALLIVVSFICLALSMSIMMRI